MQNNLGIKDTRHLMETIREVYGDDFQEVSLGVFSRRLGRAMELFGMRDPMQLEKALRAREGFYEQLLAVLVPPCTEMFRDPAFWRALREVVLEQLVVRHGEALRCWVAAQGSGEELYSLLILLEELGLRRQATVYCGYLGERGRERIQKGLLPEDTASVDAANYTRYNSAGLLGDYLVREGGQRGLRQDLLAGVEMRRVAAVVSPWESEPLHLVLCRNQFLYFTQRLSEMNMEVLWQSMAVGGVLALGIKERLENLEKGRTFIALNGAEGLYRKRGVNG